MSLDRISVDPEVCHGKPTIKGTRIPVEIILNLLAAGETEKNILQAYPHITPEDIKACLEYAAVLASEETHYWKGASH